MSQAWLIGAVAFPCLQQAATTELSLYNNGSVPIYVDTTSAVFVGSSIPLNVGSTITWRANNPLWAVCAPGKQSTLIASKGVGNVFDPSVIATAIYNQGVPSSAGFVSLDTRTAYQSTAVITASPIFDCSRYSGVQFVYTANKNISSGFPVVRTFLVEWFNNGVAVGSDTCTFNDGDALLNTSADQSSQLWLPTKGNGVRYSGGATGTDRLNYTVQVNGTYRVPAASELYYSGSAFWSQTTLGDVGLTDGRNGLSSFVNNVDILSGPHSLHPNTKAGPWTMNVTNNATTVPVFNIVDLYSGVQYNSFKMANGSTTVSGSLPPQSVWINVNLAATQPANTLIMTFVQ